MRKNNGHFVIWVCRPLGFVIKILICVNQIPRSYFGCCVWNFVYEALVICMEVVPTWLQNKSNTYLWPCLQCKNPCFFNCLVLTSWLELIVFWSFACIRTHMSYAQHLYVAILTLERCEGRPHIKNVLLSVTWSWYRKECCGGCFVDYIHTIGNLRNKEYYHKTT